MVRCLLQRLAEAILVSMTGDRGWDVPEKPYKLEPDPPPRGVDLPYDDGEPMETPRHRNQYWLLVFSLQHRLRGRKDIYVGGNEFLYFSQTQAKNNDFRGPDVYVVLNAISRDERRSWVVWEEDGRTPDVIIELLSPSTEHVDRGKKMRIYAQVLKVSAYYLYDPFTYELEGYELDPGSTTYRRIQADAGGRVYCRPLDLSLGVVEGEYIGMEIPWLRWIDPEGRVVPTAEEDAFEHLREVEQRAEAALRRAEEESRRAEEESRRAEEESRRAEEESRRAEEESRRAEELASQLAEYERKFGKLGE